MGVDAVALLSVCVDVSLQCDSLLHSCVAVGCSQSRQHLCCYHLLSSKISLHIHLIVYCAPASMHFRNVVTFNPIHHSETQLYTTIAGLSYMGDQRMTYGAENLNKVRLKAILLIYCRQIELTCRLYVSQVDNLVVAKVPSFRELYKFPLERVGTEVNLKSWQDQDNATQYSQVSVSLIGTTTNFLTPLV